MDKSSLKGTDMTTNHTLFPGLAETIETVPESSIVSRTILKADHFKAIVFAFAPGQELSQHTASVPAVIQILEGECALTIGEAAYEGKPGTWAYMEAGVPHSLLAKSAVKMLLIMM
jgi:quercetin dioxygenase-like cupin family protein